MGRGVSRAQNRSRYHTPRHFSKHGTVVLKEVWVPKWLPASGYISISCWHLGGSRKAKKLIGCVREIGFFDKFWRICVKFSDFFVNMLILSHCIAPDLKTNIIFEVRFWRFQNIPYFCQKSKKCHKNGCVTLNKNSKFSRS